MPLTLSKRLAAIAAAVPEGSRVIDVGTDHGYIPVWLAEKGRSPRMLASDIAAAPLEGARRTAALHGCTDKIEFRLCDGLSGCTADEVDAIIIAGMGGETIAKILTAAPWAAQKLLALQPQSKIYELRMWLNENGYTVRDAALVTDEGRIYVVWQVRAGGREELTYGQCLADKSLFSKRDPLLEPWLAMHLKKSLHKLGGLKKAAAVPQEEREFWQRACDELSEMRKETEKWQK